MNKGFKSVNFPSTYKYSSILNYTSLGFYEKVLPIAKNRFIAWSFKFENS